MSTTPARPTETADLREALAVGNLHKRASTAEADLEVANARADRAEAERDAALAERDEARKQTNRAKEVMLRFGLRFIRREALLRSALAEREARIVAQTTPRPIAEYHDDLGFVTWWIFPVCEPAWIGSPNCSDWPGYHTHFTPHPEVLEPALSQGATDADA